MNTLFTKLFLQSLAVNIHKTQHIMKLSQQFCSVIPVSG